MWYSKQLLSRFCTLTLSPQEVGERLTRKSCEIEEVIERSVPDLVVLGLVTEVKPHPDADKLVVCQVELGQHGNVQICTGAVNMKENIIVPVAMLGTYLPAIDLKIAERPMRGLESNGMICSLKELGLYEPEDSHDIWIIEDDEANFSHYTIGTPLSESHAWIEGRRMEVDNKTITHRPDLFGHLGVAFECRAVAGDAIQMSALPAIEEMLAPGRYFEFVAHAQECAYTTAVQTDGASSLSAVHITGTRVQPSSLRVETALGDCGLTTKNNRVDFSTYYMALTGQPIHCYDAQKISGGLTVRDATDGEQFVDLFGSEHTLTPEDVVIADGNGVVALAGIVGGLESAVSDSTTEILIELGTFDPVRVRKSAQRHNIRTDASQRFEKGIYAGYTCSLIEHCIDEIKRLGRDLPDAEFAGVSSSVGLSSFRRMIECTPDQVQRAIDGEQTATPATVQETKKSLEALGGTYDDNTYFVPVWRGSEDLEGSHDIVEEVTRIMGFDTIPEQQLTSITQSVPFVPVVALYRKVEETLAFRLGYTQIDTYPWIAPAKQVRSDAGVAIPHHLDQTQASLRSELDGSLMQIAQKNTATHPTLQYFTTGPVWNDGVETSQLGLLRSNAQASPLAHPFLQVKGDIESLQNACGFAGRLEFRPTDDVQAFAHPKQSVEIFCNGKPIGYAYTVHPLVQAEYGIDEGSTVSLAVLNLTLITPLVRPKALRGFKPSAPYQTTKDVSVVLPTDGDSSPVINALQKISAVDSLQLFDVYTGDQLKAGTKSISIRCTLNSDEPFTDTILKELVTRLEKAVTDAGATLRS